MAKSTASAFLALIRVNAAPGRCRLLGTNQGDAHAISHRVAKGFGQMKAALSVGVQQMVRSDPSGSGLMFSIDTETGFKDDVVIDAAWGLGKLPVQLDDSGMRAGNKSSRIRLPGH